MTASDFSAATTDREGALASDLPTLLGKIIRINDVGAINDGEALKSTLCANRGRSELVGESHTER